MDVKYHKAALLLLSKTCYGGYIGLFFAVNYKENKHQGQLWRTEEFIIHVKNLLLKLGTLLFFIRICWLTGLITCFSVVTIWTSKVPSGTEGIQKERQSNLPDLLPAFIHITCWTLEDLSILGLGSVISPHQRPLSSYSILLYLWGPFKGLRRFPYLLSKSTGKQCSSSAGGDQTLLSARTRRLSGVKLWGGACLIRGLSRAKVCAFTARPCVCEFASQAHPAGFNPD